MRHIFVCGSLRKGECNHQRFNGFGDILVATGAVAGAILKNLGEYPAMIVSSNDLDCVVGEVYEISDDLGEAIDRWELDAGYEVRPVSVTTSGQMPARIEAEAYFFAFPARLAGHEAVEGGDWAKHDHVRMP